MIRAVLDTNLLASGLVNRNPATPPVRIIDAWRSAGFELVISQPIEDELRRTLRNSYFAERVPDDEQRRFLALLEREATTVELVASVSGVATHEEDDRILATALNPRADYLVTGDRALLALAAFEGTRIVSAAGFVAILEASAGEAGA